MMTNHHVVYKFFKDTTVKFNFSESEELGKPNHEMINIYSINRIPNFKISF